MAKPKNTFHRELTDDAFTVTDKLELFGKWIAKQQVKRRLKAAFKRKGRLDKN